MTTSTRTAVRTRDRGATSASRIGRTSALKRAMKTSARIPRRGCRSRCLARGRRDAESEYRDDSVMARRFKSAHGPPCQFQRIWTCVRKRSIGPFNRPGLPQRRAWEAVTAPHFRRRLASRASASSRGYAGGFAALLHPPWVMRGRSQSDRGVQAARRNGAGTRRAHGTYRRLLPSPRRRSLAPLALADPAARRLRTGWHGDPDLLGCHLVDGRVLLLVLLHLDLHLAVQRHLPSQRPVRRRQGDMDCWFSSCCRSSAPSFTSSCGPR